MVSLKPMDPFVCQQKPFFLQTLMIGISSGGFEKPLTYLQSPIGPITLSKADLCGTGFSSDLLGKGMKFL